MKTGPFGTVKYERFIGMLVDNNGDPIVLRNIQGKTYRVAKTKVDRTASNWVGTPENWDQWFQEHGTDVSDATWGKGRIDLGIANAGHNDMAAGAHQIQGLAETGMYWNAGAGFNASPAELAMIAAAGRPKPIVPAPEAKDSHCHLLRSKESAMT